MHASLAAHGIVAIRWRQAWCVSVVEIKATKSFEGLWLYCPLLRLSGLVESGSRDNPIWTILAAVYTVGLIQAGLKVGHALYSILGVIEKHK